MKALIFALSLFVLIGCKKDDNSNSNSGNFDNLPADIIKDFWKISYYADDGVDETSRFTSYTFDFRQDGTVDASNDLLTETGTWIYEDSSNDSTDDEELILLFTSSNNALEEISDDWHITSASATQVVLYDISGSNGTTDYLTFTKE